LREALLERRALRPEAVERVDGHLRPGAVGDPRRQVVPVAGLRGAHPAADALHLFAQRARGAAAALAGAARGGLVRTEVEEHPRPVVRIAAVQLVAADVVPASLEDREGR